jgi:hypothetical protein
MLVDNLTLTTRPQPSPMSGFTPVPAPLVAASALHSRRSAVWRSVKVSAHIAIRAIANIFGGPARLLPTLHGSDAPIAAAFQSPLWVDGRDDELVLRCGKVQNLRVAVRGFDGVAVPAGKVLSFWSQVGRPSSRRGFVVGREIISGCVVPTIGGGLCQLSNALASAARAAGIELVQRHRHSARVEGHSPATFEDATVAWNYIDLQLRADFDFSLDVKLSRDELVVRVRRPGFLPQTAKTLRITPLAALPQQPQLLERAVARGCMTCDEDRCFRHRSRPKPTPLRRALVLNDKSPELAQWLQAHTDSADWMVPWVRSSRKTMGWLPPAGAAVHVAWLAGWQRAALQRLSRGEGGARQAGRQRAAQALARAHARVLRAEHTDLVISQDLLVTLWRLGVLGGRSYRVFVAELPAGEIQARLDEATGLQPQAQSLRDFRVASDWQRDEWAALRSATQLVTAHSLIHSTLQAAGLQVELLPWIEPEPLQPLTRRQICGPPTLTLAASALARKGALEVAEVARRIQARVLILGSAPADEAIWHGVDWSAVGYRSDWLGQTDIAVLPAHVEHQPRALLQALAQGIPVVASPACGLGVRAGLTLIEPGHATVLETAVRTVLGQHGWPR